ncbi:DUF1643 domain-containing protein [Hydrogenophaga defluvii]|uniref:DUF1643 domain-containing protein n=1 Tax=Hydrogenophaga defluvii TaxID=249410 RepID=A0ABW2SC48_9BURK
MLLQPVQQSIEGASLDAGALLSECGQYRYRLWRRWGPGAYLLFVMLNPSTADSSQDDPTVRRCIRFAQDHHYDGIEVVNLFAFRATNPLDLKAAGYPVGPDNDRHIHDAMQGAGAVCVAWGDRARRIDRAGEVLQMISAAGRVINCLAQTKHGLPGHPLMLSASCRLMPYEAPTSNA